MGKVVALRLADGSAEREEAAMAAAERLGEDHLARAFGRKVGETFLSAYGAERARRHGRVFLEAMREVIGL